MEGLLRRCARIIVMAEKGRDILQRVYGADPRQIAMIPHGVPDRALMSPEALKPRFDWEGRKVVLTFGLLAPNKGIETIIEALPAVAANHPELLYVVLGATHPNLIAHEGEAYRDRLKALADTLGVSGNVAFVDSFVEHEELLDYLQAADIYATPYSNPAQITSGTLSYAVGVGKAVVSTPYVHATEILDDDHGVLVPFGDVGAFAREIDRLLSDETARNRLSARAYARGRTMIWPRLAEAAIEQFATAITARPRRIGSAPQASIKPLAPDLAAVERMSDSTGMLQHAIYSVPDRRHGYCIDDNARALIFMTQAPDIDPVTRDKWTTIYASFLQYAWNPKSGAIATSCASIAAGARRWGPRTPTAVPSGHWASPRAMRSRASIATGPRCGSTPPPRWRSIWVRCGRRPLRCWARRRCWRRGRGISWHAPSSKSFPAAPRFAGRGPAPRMAVVRDRARL